MAKENLEGNAIEKNTIKVYGMAGLFELGKNSDREHRYRVRYFNTSVSNKNNTRAGNTLDLLKELKPMRERVTANELRDLSSLLQRDLNDYRVAHELVPYLKGEASEIGFFPGILVALMPKGFLSEKKLDYPVLSTNGNLHKYSSFWDLENFSISGNRTSLGKLSIDPNCTDLIVLDGQHRANAFRFMTNTFDTAKPEYIYFPFYQECKPSAVFNAELPVTIIWFESDEQSIDPKLISRKLFVDVNNNAKTVNEARRVLLDDTTMPALASQNFYSLMGSMKFKTNQLSLMHSCFDGDDMSSFSIFDPTIIRYAFTYFLLCQDEYENINKVPRRDVPGNQNNTNRLRRFIKDFDEEVLLDAFYGDHKKLQMVHGWLRENITEHVFKIFNELNILRVHYKSTQTVRLEITEEADSTTEQVWEKVFCGGEGLYSAFLQLPKEKQKRGKAKTYLNAIRKIENLFENKRSKAIGNNEKEVSKFFNTFSTKATITGLFMALSKFSEDTEWGSRIVDSFISDLNKVNIKDWINILTKIKPNVVKELDPKTWPFMRNIFLRVIQANDKEKTYFERIEDSSLDHYIIKNNINDKISSWLIVHRNEMVKPSDEVKEKWKNEAYDFLDNLLKNCHLKHIFRKKDIYAFTAREILENSDLVDFENEIDDIVSG